ncbi:MAG: tRNA (adenosine(37)-N6)-threonylcarbamoyltransferase complex dimerization subunit type 1 TsaB [Gammaproteobacteria bacterium]|nr:tRNA (adenosine(37)-N6)-threonylcarbamoyltransferase complex dimerization subunit type 1 TsaB [Gammaproteobacteria bacterium]MDH5800154.1 tRNA (adenosine(37)-N6)-threonylcarbamoyltransferase complex dimerization subunit type 1 TsaB [Gammaproteobacteria bacterium]
MKILALDTSTEACSAALYLDGEILEQYRLAPREHSQLVLGMCEALLAEAQIRLPQLDAVAFGRGPGSFVGVRIATGIIQGMAYATDLPVVPVSSLAALAHGSGRTHVIAAIDARMEEVYYAYYHCGEDSATALSEEGVCPAGKLPLPPEHRDWFGIGSGWQSYSHELQARTGTEFWVEAFPRAASVAALAIGQVRLGHTVDAAAALPVYIRDQVAKPQRK